MRTRVVAALALACVALGFLAGRLATRSWNSVVAYQSPYRFAEPAAPGERLDWRAILVVVDGLRYDASRRMPGLDRFRAQGADLSAGSGTPSYSRPGRANLVTGAPPELHGATTNFHKGTLAFDNLFRGVASSHGRVAIAGSDLWRSLFGPDLAGADLLESPIEEQRGQFERIAPGMISFEWKALRFLLSRKPTLGVLDLVVPDYAAHEYGARSPQYARAIFEADRVIGALADEVDLWRTLVVVTADHGHLDEGGHGGSEPEVTTVPLVLAGRGVRLGAVGSARQIDVAPTIAALVGLPLPAGSEGRVLDEILDPADLPPGVGQRAQAQQAAFARQFAATLGEAGATGVDAAALARLAADRRGRVPIAVAIALAAWGLLAWLAWPRKAATLVAAVAGGLGQEAVFRALVAEQRIRLSLSAINHDEDVGPYFARILVLGAIAIVVALAAVALTAARFDPDAVAAHALAAVLGGALLLGMELLATYIDQGLLMAWRIGDLARGFDAFVDLVRLQAIGFSAVLVLPLVWGARRRARAGALAVALLLASAPARAATILADVPAHPDPQPRFESGTDIVAVDAAVVDERGLPVTNLRPEEFTISVDGRQRAVAFAEYHSLGRAPVTPARRFSSNEGAVGGRLVAIVVDQSSLPPGAARQILTGAGALLERLTAADRSALITLPQGSGPQVDFTPDHARLEKALERVTGQMGTGPRARVGIGDALAMTRGDSFATEEVVNRECAFLRGSARDQCVNEVQAEAISVAAQARQQAVQTAQGLRAVIAQLGRVEGPKTMVLVARSLLEEDSSDVKSLAELAASARILLFVILAGGDVPDASVGRVLVASAADRRMQVGGLEHLSSLLGGEVLRVSGNSDAAFARVASELSGRYTLGFEPQPRERDGRAHTLRVQSRRAGVVVRARSIIQLPARGPAERKEDAVIKTLQRPDLVGELPLRVATYIVRDSNQDQVRVLVSAEVGQSGASSPSGIAVGFVLRDRSGQAVGGGFEALPDTGDAGPALFVGAAAVPPGAYLLKLAARDGRGRLGSVEHPLQAALTDAGALSVSDLILSGREDVTLRPGPDTEIRGRGCLAYLELYGRAPHALDAASVALEVAGSEDGPALVSVAAPLAAGSAADHRIAQVDVPLEQLPAGEYLARAVVSVSGRAVRRVTQPFRLAR